MKKLLILFLLFLVGCTEKPNPVDTKPIVPTAIEIVNLSGANEITVGENNITLTYVTTPSNASQDITWSSSDPQVATVNENGEVTGVDSGVAIIYATSTHDKSIYGEIEITVYNDGPSNEKIEEIISYLEDVIPNQATDSAIELPLFYDGDIRLYWQSSDPYTIDSLGRVTAGRKNINVMLKATFKVGRVNGEFTKHVFVPKYELKSREDKKLTFTYLFDAGGFTGFREGDLDRIDVINLSFGGISYGKLSVAGLQNRARIISEAHAAGTRVVLAIGGWGVDGFSQAVRTSESRKVFINSIIEGINRYRFDGIDIDWEYPGSTAGGYIEAHPQDKYNLTLFMQELRAEMDKIDQDLILSIAVACGEWAARDCYEVEKINDYIDFMHLMSYDLVNHAKTSHHTNLFKSNYSDSSTVNGINAYLNRGLDREKLVIGVAFYGYIFKNTASGNNNGLGVSDTSAGTVTYRAIVQNYLNNPNLYQVFYDDVAKANWIYGNNTFITYDSPISIAEKAKYVKNNNLAGLMVWQYTQDDDDSTLLKAIYNNLK